MPSIIRAAWCVLSCALVKCRLEWKKYVKLISHWQAFHNARTQKIGAQSFVLRGKSMQKQNLSGSIILVRRSRKRGSVVHVAIIHLHVLLASSGHAYSRLTTVLQKYNAKSIPACATRSLHRREAVEFTILPFIAIYGAQWGEHLFFRFLTYIFNIFQ